MDADPDTLLRQCRWSELTARLDAGEAGPAERRLRGELSCRGRGPITDAVIAARDLARRGDPSASEWSAQAARLLCRAGARRTAISLLADAERASPGAEAVALVREQLDSGCLLGDTRDEWEAHRALAAADFEGARARFRAIASNESADVVVRMRALRTLGDLARADRDFRSAAVALDAARALAPEGDDAQPLALAAALCRWAAADAGAVAELRELRDRTARGEGVAAHVHRVCAEVIEAIDREGGARSPAWMLAHRAPSRPLGGADSGRAAAAAVLDALGVSERPLDPLPTMAHVRRALERAGLRVLRMSPSEEQFRQALARGAAIVVEEERPTDTGFLLVLGHEATARLLLLHDPSRPGPFLRSVMDHERRGALFAGSAVVVPAPGAAASALEDHGLAHDERFDLVDRCELDEEGQAPPRAHTAALCRRALEVGPALPLPRLRLGRALVDQMRAGDAGTAEYPMWYAEARTRFPDAEWPHQIHAEVLELAERFEEAGIAWADAALRDPFDERNHRGSARARARLGDRAGAERSLRRALALRPDDPESMRLAAELALDLDDDESAELYAAVASDLAPDDPAVLATRATVHERAGELANAAELLSRVAKANPRNVHVVTRLWQTHLLRGAFGDAERVAEGLRLAVPSAPEGWAAAAYVAYARGDCRRALSTSHVGVQRCGPDPRLLSEAARALAAGFPPDLAAEAARPLLSALGADPEGALDLASHVADHGAVDLALRIGRDVCRDRPDVAEARWRTARLLLVHPTTRTHRRRELVALLEESIAHAPRFPLPRVFLGWMLLDEDPGRALDLATGADLHVSPALVWGLMERAFGALGQAHEAAKVGERMMELFPDGAVSGARVLRNHGFHAQALDLLDRAAEVASAQSPISLEIARTHLSAGDPERASAALAEVDGQRHLRLDIAEAASDWPGVEAIALELVRDGRRRTGEGFEDVWPLEARAAGAALAAGHAAPRERLMSAAGEHPGVLLSLLRIERRVDGAPFEQTTAVVERVAPGLLAVLAAEDARR